MTRCDDMGNTLEAARCARFERFDSRRLESFDSRRRTQRRSAGDIKGLSVFAAAGIATLQPRCKRGLDRRWLSPIEDQPCVARTRSKTVTFLEEPTPSVTRDRCSTVACLHNNSPQ